MRIALLSDVHGNLPALKAVLGNLQGFHPNLLAVAGDLVGGLYLNETIDLLQEQGALCIAGK